MKFCPHCGQPIADNAKFCDKCGQSINPESQTNSSRLKHKSNKSLILTLIIIALVVVISAGIYLFTSGATNQVSTKQPSATTSKAKENDSETTKPKSDQSSSTKTASNKSNSAIWNQSKSTKLDNFMASWGSDMHQDYDPYNPSNQDNYMGYHFPAYFSKNNIRVNDTPVSVGWSNDGSGSNDYNVVAIYSDLDSNRNKENTVGAHLYLFTIHNGQPVVLFTQQNQGNEENAIYFKPTANQDVSSQFANIVNHNQMNY